MSCLTQVLFFVHVRGADHAANVYPGVYPSAFFPGPIESQIFQQIVVPQGQLQFAADCCPLYPRPKADILTLQMHVRFTPESGHVRRN